MMKNFSLLLSIAGLCLTDAFAPTTSVGLGRASSKSTTSVQAIDPSTIPDIITARAVFVLSFAAAIGTAAVGREVIPVTLREWKKLNLLKGQGRSSMSGEQLDLVGYPEPVYSDDVMTVINNEMSPFDMVEKYPVEGALPGYLRFESLAQANPDVSQVAVRALFDSIAVGLNKNSVAPQIFAAKVEQYKQDGLGSMVSNSRLSKTIGVAALVILLVLLGSADYFALFHLFHGWFPEWSGTSRLPMSLLDFPAYLELPQSYLADVPEMPVTSGAFPMK